MTDREIGLVLQLISDSILENWATLNGKIAQSKGNRPVWKITEVENDLYVDELQGLLAQAKRLEKLAKEFRGVDVVLPPIDTSGEVS
mgnify:CR=1 FL=1